jgi:hypothetical protein
MSFIAKKIKIGFAVCIFAFALANLFAFTMVPRVKNAAWIHVDVVDGEMYCKYCKKHIEEGGIHRLKQHLAGIRGQISPCEAPTEDIGHIRLKLQNQFEKFEEDKAR